MKILSILAAVLFLATSPALANDHNHKEGEENHAEPAAEAKGVAGDEFTIIIKDHKFSPAEVVIPANKKVKLNIDNQDPTPEEFESHDLKREKIIKGNSKGVVVIGPLAPGEYKFFGEFNEKTAQGVIKVQ